MKRLIAGASLLSLLAGLSCYAATPEEEIRAAEKAWAAAVVKTDIATLDKVFTPALFYAHASGAIENKQQYLDRLKTGKQKYDSFTHESINVAVYGTTVVTHSICRSIGKNDKGPFNDHIMMLHVWIKQGSDWKLAGHQTTKLP